MKTSTINKFDYYYLNSKDSQPFMQMPKALYEGSISCELTRDAKVLYMMLHDRKRLSTKNNWIDEDGRVYIYFTQEEAMVKLQFGSSKINKLFKELDKYGLISRKKQGLAKADIIYVKNISTFNENNIPKPVQTNKTSGVDEITALKNEVTRLKEVIAKFSNSDVENYKDVVNYDVVESVENYENGTKEEVKTCEKDNSRLIQNTSQDLSKTQASNNNSNKNKSNNNNSVNRTNAKNAKNETHNSNDERMNEKNNNFKSITKQTIKELISKDTIKDAELSELFCKSLNLILTNSKYENYSEKVYNKFFSDRKNTAQLDNLANQSVIDFIGGSNYSNVKYPMPYMCKCILNAFENEKVKKAAYSYKTTPATEYKPLANTSYDIAEADEWLNTVPKYVDDTDNTNKKQAKPVTNTTYDVAEADDLTDKIPKYVNNTTNTTNTNNTNNTNNKQSKPLAGTTYDIAEADEWLNTVPKYVNDTKDEGENLTHEEMLASIINTCRNMYNPDN